MNCKKIVRRANSGDATLPTKPKGKKKLTKIVQANVIPKCSLKYLVLNTNLKYAIGNCRSHLEKQYLQLRNTNYMMTDKIVKWISREETKSKFRTIYTEEPTIREDNEKMRQALSDLINGPLSSLLPKWEVQSVRKLIIPQLPPQPKKSNQSLRRASESDTDFFKGYNSQTEISKELLYEAARIIKRK